MFSPIDSWFIVSILTHKSKNSHAQDKKAYEGVQAQFHSFSTLVLAGEGSATLPPEKIPLVPINW
jgi:hypothetical protein